MNKILVLAKNKETYFIRRLIEEVDLDSLEIFNPFEFENPINMFNPDVILCRSTGVYRDDRDLEFLNNKKSRIINSFSSLITFRKKSTQYEFFNKHSFNVLPWMKCCSSIDHFMNFKKLLIKPDAGQGGRGIIIMEPREYDIWFTQQLRRGDIDFVVQPYFLPLKELRVFFIQQNLWVLERWSEQGPVNFFQGGLARPATLSGRDEAEVRRLIDSSGAFYGGIDLLVGKDESYILELNTVPGVEQLEFIFKENILKLLIKNIFNH